MGWTNPDGPWTDALAFGFGLPVSNRWLLHLATSYASGADAEATDASVNPGPNALKVRLKGSLGNIVGVADLLTSDCTLAANIALLRHVDASSICQ